MEIQAREETISKEEMSLKQFFSEKVHTHQNREEWWEESAPSEKVDTFHNKREDERLECKVRALKIQHSS